MDRDEAVLRAITECVLAHLSRCPNAADTADGIRGWWLTALPAVDPHAVDIALDRLVEQGVLERVATAGGAPVYRRARHDQ
jgi:Fe2+ or Zn2+ uptake regulation protein